MRLRVAAALSAISCVVLIGHADAAEPAPDEQQLQYEYESWFGLHRHEAHYGRAALEVVGLMGLGLLYYWVDPLANKEDWDNPTISDRLKFRAIRFDTNLNPTNHLLHPIAGGLVYTAARVNGLSIPVSFGYGLAQSVFWAVSYTHLTLPTILRV